MIFKNKPDSAKYALAAKLAYERALKENDADALSVKNLSDNPRSESAPATWKKRTGMKSEKLNKIIAFSLKQVVGYVAGAASHGVVSSTLTDFIVDSMADIAGVPMPKDGQALVLERLGNMMKMMERLEEGQEEIKAHTSREHQIKTVKTTASLVSDIWKELHLAMKYNDCERFFANVGRVETDRVSKALDEMSDELIDPHGKFPNPLASSLQRFYKNALCSTNHSLTFDVKQYWAEVTHWRDLVVSIDRMGTALLILYEQFRDIPKASKLEWQIRRRDDSEHRRKRVDDIFLGDIATCPSFNLLHELASANLEDHFPQLWEFRSEARKSMCVDDKHKALENVQVFGEDCYGQGTQVSKAFGLERLEDGVWQIRASPALQRSVDCVPFARWGLLRDDRLDPSFKDWGSPSMFKIIPLEHVSDKGVRLLWLDHDKKAMRKSWDIILTPSSLFDSYPKFGESSEEAFSHFRDLINTRSEKRFHCKVENQTPYIFVLDDAYSNGSYYYENTVWLPDDKICVGGHGTRLRACFRFALYMLKDAPADPEKLRLLVEELWGPLPGTGRLGLRSSGAQLVSYLWLRLQVPEIRTNMLSAVELNADDPNRDIVDLSKPEGLKNNLLEYVANPNEKNTHHSWHRVQAHMEIEKGSSPWAQFVVSLKGH